MGNFNCGNGLQTGISPKTVIHGDKENSSVQTKYRYFYGRNRIESLFEKKCNRESSISRNSTRFLQHLISSSQEKREIENDNKFKTIEQSLEKDSFQNGHNGKSDQSSETKRLGDFTRSFRRVSSCATVCRPQKIHEVLYSKPMFSVENSMFRSNVCTEGVHKISNSSGSSSQSTKHSNSGLSGRLADSQSKRKPTSERSSEMLKSSSFSGVYNKQREIQFDTQSTVDLSRGIISFRQGASVSNCGENRQTPNVDSENVRRRDCSSRLFENFRDDGIMCRTDTKCSSTHETNTTSSVKFLESHDQRHEYKCSIYSTSEIPFNMVVRFSEHAERPIFSIASQHYYPHNRCFEKRVWGSPWESFIPRGVVSSTETLAHQLLRNEGSSLISQTFSGSSEEQMCIDQERQYQCRSIHKSTRGNQVTPIMLLDMGIVADGYSKQDSFKVSSHSRDKEHFGRPIKSSENSTIRMDIGSVNSTENIPNFGRPFNRSVCVSRQQANKGILFLDSPSRCFSNGCTHNSMGGNVCLCFSPDMHDTQGIEIYEAVPLSGPTHSASVAKETLVCRPSSVVDSSSNSTSGLGQSAESTQIPDLSSQSSNVKSDGMAALHRNFQAEGFSESARNLLSASWRKGTQQDYIKKFEKFNSWCSQKQINPYTASLNQIADFLVYLFESGLQYRTISGYRSMLSAVLNPVGNHQVGQHPHICRLLKGVFHSRPPKTKLLPEWDLQLVLRSLESKSFEPLGEKPLKLVTLKTVFLIAITTFRRCSDIQSLRIDHQSMQVQKKGITFIRHGLSKQDRQSHLALKYMCHISLKIKFWTLRGQL